MNNTINAADLFCGAGGFTTGLMQACHAKDLKLKMIAVNHWQIAIDTHSTNHPDVEHACTNLDNVDPRKLVPSGKLDLLLASPECTHHSKARGGKPINDQSRASAWRVAEWATQLQVRSILIENVPDFLTWGPLNADGKPNKRRKGELFLAFVNSLKAHGYKVDWKVLNCANHGDATTRPRLFIQAKRGRGQITWPEATHAPKPKVEKQATLFKTGLKPYKPARACIDWDFPSQSIFTRKKSLALNTLRRIAAGLKKFSGLPFVIPQFSAGANRSVDDPLPTIMTDGAHALCQPFITLLRGQSNVASIDDPLNSISTKGAHHGLVQPFIIPFFGERNGQTPRTHSIDQPLQTVTGQGAGALIEPFVLNISHANANGDNVRSVAQPLATLTTQQEQCLVQPFVVPVNHGEDNRSYSLDNPMPTITAFDAWALVQPFLVKFFGTAETASVDEPLDTITTKDRFGLVQPILQRGKDLFALDIHFRMLQPKELAAAMSFPTTYSFAGTREHQVRQIGNAVPVLTAQALCEAILS